MGVSSMMIGERRCRLLQPASGRFRDRRCSSGSSLGSALSKRAQPARCTQSASRRPRSASVERGVSLGTPVIEGERLRRSSDNPLARRSSAGVTRKSSRRPQGRGVGRSGDVARNQRSARRTGPQPRQEVSSKSSASWMRRVGCLDRGSDGSWLCSWAVLIAEVDGRHALGAYLWQHASGMLLLATTEIAVRSKRGSSS
jgi:hypothetical protein